MQETSLAPPWKPSLPSRRCSDDGPPRTCRHVDGDRIDIAGNGPRAAIGLQGRHGQHTGAGADIGDIAKIPHFFQARDRRHAAVRGGMLAGAEGEGEERWRWLVRRLVQEDLLSESDDGSQRLWLKPAGRRYLLQPWPLRWVA